MSKGILVILSGFSGVGKGTAMRELVRKYGYGLSISATTRAPREEDTEGVTYFFKTRDEFEQMIEENGLLEYAQYNGNYYGTPKFYVDDQLSKGKTVFLEIEVQGAMKVKEIYPDAAMVFITAPDAQTLKTRLEGRGSENEEQIAGRLRAAVEEAKSMPYYDYIVCNEQGKLDECVEKIHGIVETVACEKARQAEFISKMQKDLEKFL